MTRALETTNANAMTSDIVVNRLQISAMIPPKPIDHIIGTTILFKRGDNKE